MKKLDILFEDDYLLIVNKRPNLLTIATDKERTKNLYYEVSAYVKKKHKNNKIFIVNRLDRETSGIVIFAKRFDIKEKMQVNFSDVRRFYLAMVEGSITSQDVTLNIKENKASFKSYPDKSGVLTKTNIRLIKDFKRYSFIEIEILTGKKHQIRCTLEYLNHPVIGDKKYSSKMNLFRRIMLHAYKIIFIHPVTMQKIEVETKVPDNFLKIMEVL